MYLNYPSSIRLLEFKIANNMATTNGTNGSFEHGDVTIDEFMSREYDFVICGGGTAGLTLAARLTENPDVKVGVLEAGKNKVGDMFVDTPAMHIQLLGNPEYDWILNTTEQVGVAVDTV